ncbi:hypothetical protein OEZ85_013247 [Tetradesmus obliquus]|uniref:Uncharacterized protein n=1 Tax=Tetradesmus obliquus TaxID=3088 RepID=A0ABY8U834_TETOB|nr:hypothetical protein OEZ85_013247 [Tetradesmus obliquus]
MAAYALSSVSRRAALTSSFRVQVVEQPYPLQAAAPSSHAPASSCGSGSRYAIVKLGGVRQMVEEGHAYTCPKHYLQEAPHGDSSGVFVFRNVLGLRSDGTFRWGKPYLTDAAVEVELLEEFAGPLVVAPAGLQPAAEADRTMAKYRVKAISAAGSTGAVQ